MLIKVIEADITSLAVDAVVNAAQESLLGGGGVDGAIHEAAGHKLLDACRQIPEIRPGIRCPTGEARITPGFDLPARYVIHTVGPVWRGGDQGEDLRLAKCYRACFVLARQYNVQTIAFPAVSCGIFGFPADAACAIAVEESLSALRQNRYSGEITLCAFNADLRKTYLHYLAMMAPD
ncbi:MAG: O-acetyl-ADP-ribose deacetylase [Ahniella sp.]|nr:O-acetyl-ADP-ribose deacetylase [Ahniella sp.]